MNDLKEQLIAIWRISECQVNFEMLRADEIHVSFYQILFFKISNKEHSTPQLLNFNTWCFVYFIESS